MQSHLHPMLMRILSHCYIEVVWIDYMADSDWVEEKEITLEPKELLCRSLGYYLNENDNVLVMSSRVGIHDTQRDTVHIPKGMIKDIKLLREGSK